MPESGGNKHRDYSRFDGMSTEMLEEILRADSQLPGGESSDTDAILYIMEVIAKREKENSTGKFTDVDDAWTSFNKNYLPYINDDKSLYDFEEPEKPGIKQTPIKPSHPLRVRRLIRVAIIAAAVTVLILASTITASAFGVDLWGRVAKWTMDTFGFSRTVSVVETSPNISSKQEDTSLLGTLNRYGISAKLAPTWVPGGYALDNVDIAETPTRTTFQATYMNNGNEITVSIASLSLPSTRTYEKDDADVTTYSVNGIDHYIMSNLDYTNIVWKKGNYECQISGIISLDDAKKMIDSIYEGK